MSKQAQLPPRCPVQKKNTNRPDTVALSTSTFKDIKEQQKSMSHGSTLDEQPEWLNDLLGDSGSNSNGTLHRRAASDSLTFFNGLVPLSGLDSQQNTSETPDSCEPDDGLESRCNYGPNSPRTKNRSGFPEKEIVSAFPEYVVQNPIQHLDGPTGFGQLNSHGNACGADDAINAKRHPGQRSRVRKLQYIAELERTVHIFQNLVSELSVRVESLMQQNVALSMENNTLKQQLLIMQQEKFMLEGQYRSLAKELDMVKSGLTFSPNMKKLSNWSLPAAANLPYKDATWEIPDIGKLDLK